jgi:molybdopterin-containing oxidoreductase family membrane subunit
LPLLVISIAVFVAAWLKRYIIVAPPQGHPYLPIQNVPIEWMVYKPTVIEAAIAMATLILVLIIITLLSKLFPVIPIWELAEEEAEATEEKNKQ